MDKGNEDIGEEDFDEEADKECSSVFAVTEEESEKMAAAVRSEGPTNLAEKLKARNHASLYYTKRQNDLYSRFFCKLLTESSSDMPALLLRQGRGNVYLTSLYSSFCRLVQC